VPVIEPEVAQEVVADEQAAGDPERTASAVRWRSAQQASSPSLSSLSRSRSTDSVRPGFSCAPSHCSPAPRASGLRRAPRTSSAGLAVPAAGPRAAATVLTALSCPVMVCTVLQQPARDRLGGLAPGVLEARGELAGAAKKGLVALSVGVGLGVCMICSRPSLRRRRDVSGEGFDLSRSASTYRPVSSPGRSADELSQESGAAA
jgi:hypothetical protein